MRRCGRRRLCPLLRGLSFGLLLLPHLRALASEQLSAPLVSEDAVVLDALLEVCGMGVLVCVRARHDATCEVSILAGTFCIARSALMWFFHRC